MSSLKTAYVNLTDNVSNCWAISSNKDCGILREADDSVVWSSEVDEVLRTVVSWPTIALNTAPVKLAISCSSMRSEKVLRMNVVLLSSPRFIESLRVSIPSSNLCEIKPSSYLSVVVA